MNSAELRCADCGYGPIPENAPTPSHDCPQRHHTLCDVRDIDPAIGRPTKPCNCRRRTAQAQNPEEPA